MFWLNIEPIFMVIIRENKGKTYNMTSDNHLRLNGIVVDHAHDVFRIRIDGQDETHPLVRAKLSGKMRMNKINLQVGDKVVVEVSVYDLTNGRVVQRLSSGNRRVEQLVEEEE